MKSNIRTYDGTGFRIIHKTKNGFGTMFLVRNEVFRRGRCKTVRMRTGQQQTILGWRLMTMSDNGIFDSDGDSDSDSDTEPSWVVIDYNTNLEKILVNCDDMPFVKVHQCRVMSFEKTFISDPPEIRCLGVHFP
jgi:hypothetical protein